MDLDKILLKHFLPKYKHGYVQITEKKYFFPTRYKQYANEFENFEVRDSDVYVMGAPKTGTTWTQEMVWCIGNDVDLATATAEDIRKRCPLMDMSIVNDPRDYPHLTLPEYLQDSFGFVKRQADPRFIKTHLPWDMLPRQIRTGAKTPKIIYIYRNPMDTLVSHYHHLKKFNNFSGSFAEYFELFINGRVTYAPFVQHVLSFWRQRHRDNLLIVGFEDRKRDLRGEIVKVAAFLEKSLTEEQIDALETHLRFDTMQHNKAVNSYQFLPPDVKFMRSGTVGGYKAEMTQDMIQRMEAWVADQLKNVDFTF